MSVERAKSPKPLLGAEISDNVREFVKKRASITGRLTSFIKFVNMFEGAQLTRKQVTELKLRCEGAKLLNDEFNSVQNKIEELVLDSEISQQLDIREAFDNNFYQIMATVDNLLENFRPSDESSRCNNSAHAVVKLPTISLNTFDGSYDSWLEFRDTYLSMIHNTQLDDIQKFHYLRSSLVGNAAQVIKSVEFTRENYATAWELITNRYNNSKLLIHNHIKGIFSIPHVNKESYFHIRKLIDTILKNLRALKTLGEPTESWDTLIIYIITSKLDLVIEKEWEQFKNNITSHSNRRIELNDLLSFLKDKADTLEMVRSHQSSYSNRTSCEQTKKTTSQSFVHTASTRSNVHAKHKTTRTCILCNGNHSLYVCDKFIKLSIEDRLEFVNRNRLCTNCLRVGHTATDCWFSSCKLCNNKHNSLLHIHSQYATGSTEKRDSPSKPTQSSTTLHSYQQSRVNMDCNRYTLNTVLLSTALVEVAGDDNNYYKARALLDNGSQHSIITNSLRDKINAHSIQSSVQITGIGNSVTKTNQSCEIRLKSLHGNYNTRINCIVLNNITNSLPSIELDFNSLNVPYNIHLADPTFHSPSEIDLLIGADCFWELLLDGRIRLPKGPYLQNTTLGWIISGTINNNIKSNNYRFSCNFSESIELNDQLKKFWELEEINTQTPVLSPEDKLCEQLFTETTKRLNGRFSVRIPLKKPVESLGDSFETAKSRFLSLEKRLQRSPQYKQMYTDFMREYLSLGHMTRIDGYTGPCYFLPHHGVFREHSTTTKLRVVFSANQKTVPTANSTSCDSLNDIQMSGPALQNDLFSILLRFRQYKYVACADIEKMFRQVLIQEDQRNLQLILWRENPADTLGIYMLNVVTYGTKSAPYLSMRCIKQLAFECDDQEISRTMLNDFYVDDLITGHDSKDKLLENCKKLSEVCLSGCFPLRKWTFNFKEIPPEIQNNTEESKCLSLDQSYSDRVLGLGWLRGTDEFHFVSKINVNTSNLTKRFMLSVVSQIYDPLGLLSPIIIIGKHLLQQAWGFKIGWDDLVPNSLLQSWTKFIDIIKGLSSIRIPRFILQDDYDKIELHIFCDASQIAYGAVAYCRTRTHRGDTTVNLLCSKSRVAPVKTITIPRLELCGALLAARLLHKITGCLNLRFNDIFMWTDSTIVLGWLNIPSYKLKPFVQNRVNEINDLACNAKWLHVNSNDNPADLISRGANLTELHSSTQWWNGPSFLQQDNTIWKVNHNDNTFEVDSLPELKQCSVALTCKNNYVSFINFSRFSNFNRLLRCYAYVLRFIRNSRCKRKTERQYGSLSVTELERSLLLLTRQAQLESFQSEYNALSTNSNIKSDRNLTSLNLFLDPNGIIRVGGRLVNSYNLSYNKKHPMLVCSKHHFTLLLFRYKHLKLLHAGPQLLLSHIREDFWPISGRNLARKTVNQCVTCSRVKPRLTQPIMGNLPSERLSPGVPFLHVGVDYAGPFYILNRKGRGARLEKAYLCLFVCFATRALHLELVTSLTSEGYILALKRFISRRGKPRKILSDNGRNFVGAKEFFNFLNTNYNVISEYASDNNIEFETIVPYSPHTGGLWEAGVRSCKHHLARVVCNANLTYEEFSTVLVQIEAVLNSRPMYPMSSDPNDFSPLTPAHFLIGRPLVAPAEEDVMNKAITTLSRYKRIEQLRQSFWKRWSMEYISELQQRTKWKTTKDDLQPGMLVVIKEDGLPPLRWKLGRIITAYPGKDGINRVADIRTATGVIKRTFSKICPLPVPVVEEASN